MSTNDWEEANQRYLAAALSHVRNALEQYIARIRGVTGAEKQQDNVQQALDEAMSAMPAPAALTKLCAAFGLSPFERDVLLLCAGMDLDSAFAGLCAAAQNSQWNERNDMGGGYTTAPYPTFSLALAALPNAHWDALTPTAPLRRWRLIGVGSSNTLTLNHLRIDEHILHYLVGVSSPDERLAGIIAPASAATDLVPSHRLLVERLVAAWSQAIETTKCSPLPEWGKSCRVLVVQLCGEDPTSKADIAAAACAMLGLRLSLMSADALPAALGEIEVLVRLWEREAVLSGSALLLDCDSLDMSDTAKMTIITRVIQQMNSPLIVTTSERCRLPRRQMRPMITFDVRKPGTNEQRAVWENTLGSVHLNGHIDVLVSQFNLNPSAIHAVSAGVLDANQEKISDDRALGATVETTHNELGDLLWDACRVEARPGLDDLAQRIEPGADWDVLVLPEAQQQLLREIAAHVRQRTTVYETWGFSARGARGLGISALFAGASHRPLLGCQQVHWRDREEFAACIRRRGRRWCHPALRRSRCTLWQTQRGQG